MPDQSNSDFGCWVHGLDLLSKPWKHLLYRLRWRQSVGQHQSTKCPVSFQRLADSRLDLGPDGREQGSDPVRDFTETSIPIVEVDVRVEKGRAFRDNSPDQIGQADELGTAVDSLSRAVYGLAGHQ